MHLAFHADSTSADELGVGFESNVEHFAAMVEDGDLCRIWWHDGTRGEDERLVRITRVELTSRSLCLSFASLPGDPRPCPYDGARITYEDDDDRFGDFQDVFSRLLAGAPDRLLILE